MRVVDIYRFDTGTKIPFSELPDRIRAFLDDTRLNYTTFLYYFSDLVSCNPDFSKSGVAKFLKDCSDAGPVKTLKKEAQGGFDKYWVSNIPEFTGNIDGKILPLIKKIHRYYGMAESNLYFYDIDFGGDLIPWERDLSIVDKWYSESVYPPDYDYMLNYQPLGSGIMINKDVFGASLTLSVDGLSRGEIKKTEPYAEELKKHLDGTKYDKTQKIKLDPEDTDEAEKCNQKAAALLDEIRSRFKDALPSSERLTHVYGSYSIAPTLKKYAKGHGYNYYNVFPGVLFIEKRTEKGPVIGLITIRRPGFSEVTVTLSVEGIGYRHVLLTSSLTPDDQESFDSYMKKVFSLVEEFERDYYPALAEIYPTVPDWFVTEK